MEFFFRSLGDNCFSVFGLVRGKRWYPHQEGASRVDLKVARSRALDSISAALLELECTETVAERLIWDGTTPNVEQLALKIKLKPNHNFKDWEDQIKSVILNELADSKS